jgi:ABC-2 type transport system ATP-binding protein
VAAVAEFHDVRKSYPDDFLGRRKVEAVRGVSLRIDPGEVFGLLGPNRAGKTTLVKMLLGLCRPTAGTIRRLGQPVADRSTLARVGYMHENHAFPRYLTATELLRFYGALALVPHEELDTRVRQLLERVGLADRSREPIARFSKGMVQRLGLAQALVNRPDLLVLDEPTEGLDLEGRQLLRAVMSELRSQGRTVLLVSHVLPEVQQLCDRVAVLVAGRVVRVAPTAELTARTGGDLEAVLQDLYRQK